jgi:site-specific DNA-methyltransferase (adenine-specific)
MFSFQHLDYDINSMSDFTLYHDDNLNSLKKHIKEEYVDLIYLDPPFASQSDYGYLSRGNKPETNSASSKAFSDKWTWNDEVNELYENTIASLPELIAQTLMGFQLIIGKSELLAYLSFMAPRLLEMKRTLKASGSIYLHCDQHASSHLRVLMDSIFGRENYLNTIVWCYGLGGSSPRYWPRKHDDILWYSRELNGHYFKAAKIPATSNRMKNQMKKAPDFWNIPTINNMATERNGYPTQKPEALLERIILSTSRKGDIVLDPFCGSGTTLIVSVQNGRNAIGIDSNLTAINLAKERLNNVFN